MDTDQQEKNDLPEAGGVNVEEQRKRLNIQPDESQIIENGVPVPPNKGEGGIENAAGSSSAELSPEEIKEINTKINKLKPGSKFTANDGVIRVYLGNTKDGRFKIKRQGESFIKNVSKDELVKKWNEWNGGTKSHNTEEVVEESPDLPESSDPDLPAEKIENTGPDPEEAGEGETENIITSKEDDSGKKIIKRITSPDGNSREVIIKEGDGKRKIVVTYDSPDKQPYIKEENIGEQAQSSDSGSQVNEPNSAVEDVAVESTGNQESADAEQPKVTTAETEQSLLIDTLKAGDILISPRPDRPRGEIIRVYWDKEKGEKFFIIRQYGSDGRPLSKKNKSRRFSASQLQSLYDEGVITGFESGSNLNNQQDQVVVENEAETDEPKSEAEPVTEPETEQPSSEDQPTVESVESDQPELDSPDQPEEPPLSNRERMKQQMAEVGRMANDLEQTENEVLRKRIEALEAKIERLTALKKGELEDQENDQEKIEDLFIAFPEDINLVKDLQRKLSEYHERRDSDPNRPYQAPELTAREDYKEIVLKKLLTKGKVDFGELIKEFEAKHGFVDMDALRNAYMVINGYATRNLEGIEGGTGLDFGEGEEIENRSEPPPIPNEIEQNASENGDVGPEFQSEASRAFEARKLDEKKGPWRKIYDWVESGGLLRKGLVNFFTWGGWRIIKAEEFRVDSNKFAKQIEEYCKEMSVELDDVSFESTNEYLERIGEEGLSQSDWYNQLSLNHIIERKKREKNQEFVNLMVGESMVKFREKLAGKPGAEEKLADIERKLRSSLIDVRKGNTKKKAKEFAKIYRQGINEKWWRNYVYGSFFMTTAALGSTGVQYLLMPNQEVAQYSGEAFKSFSFSPPGVESVSADTLADAVPDSSAVDAGQTAPSVPEYGLGQSGAESVPTQQSDPANWFKPDEAQNSDPADWFNKPEPSDPANWFNSTESGQFEAIEPPMEEVQSFVEGLKENMWNDTKRWLIDNGLPATDKAVNEDYRLVIEATNKLNDIQIQIEGHGGQLVEGGVLDTKMPKDFLIDFSPLAEKYNLSGKGVFDSLFQSNPYQKFIRPSAVNV